MVWKRVQNRLEILYFFKEFGLRELQRNLGFQGGGFVDFVGDIQGFCKR